MMKFRYIAGGLLLAGCTITLSGCSDDDEYSAATGNIITTIETGDAVVTAVSAELKGKVLDLSKQNSDAYSVGVVYGENPDPTTAGTKTAGSIDSTGTVTTQLKGLTKGHTYYYSTYATLQGIVTKYGEVKSFVATDAKIATIGATDITATKATLGAQTQGLDGIMIEGESEMNYGFKISTDKAHLSDGYDYPIVASSNHVSKSVQGLLPGTTYYYTSYFQLGDGYVYGDTLSFTTAQQEMPYVDLGLSVLWAQYNLGAEAEEESGVHLGYGDLTGSNVSTYLTDYSVATDIAGTDQDILHQIDIDGDALMQSALPTQEQMAELVSGTTQKEETVNGVNGVRFTSKSNGNSIFIPYGGYRDGQSIVGEGAQGLLWSGSIYAPATDYSQTLNITNGAASTGVSKRSLGLAIRSVRRSPELSVDNSKLVIGDLENNGRIRVEIYNQYGSTANHPGITPSMIKFSKNMAITFTIKGLNDNYKNGTNDGHSNIAGLEYASASWSPSRWSSLTGDKYDANVTGDGTYTVWMETSSAAEGAAVFCVDINNLANDVADVSKVSVEINSIKFDIDPLYVMDYSNTVFVNKDNDNTNGRIEIYNEYGSTKSAGVNASSLSFEGNMIVNFTITGIDGNLKPNASNAYRTELSYAAASWSPSYWGGSEFGRATVTGDGTYEVFATLNAHAEGAVVWTIELYDLWKDLIDPTQVSVKINSVTCPGIRK